MSSISIEKGAAVAPAWRSARYRRILAAAIGVMQREPEDGLSMDRVARAAGVGKATLYRYFETKEALVRACLQEVIGALGDSMEAAEESGRPPPERLHAIVGCMVETFSNHLVPLRVVTRHQRELEETWRWWVLDARRRLVAVLRRHFERGRREGVYGGLDLELVPHMVMGMIRSCVTHTSGYSNERLRDEVAGFVLAGAAR